MDLSSWRVDGREDSQTEWKRREFVIWFECRFGALDECVSLLDCWAWHEIEQRVGVRESESVHLWQARGSIGDVSVMRVRENAQNCWH